MKKFGRLLPDLAPTLLSLLLALGVSTVFSACGVKEDGTWMRCHGVQNTVTLLAAAMTALLALRVFMKREMLRAVFSVIALIGAVLCCLLPGTLQPLCMLHTMRCYTVMTPFVRILSVLIAILCTLLLLRSIRRLRRRKAQTLS